VPKKVGIYVRISSDPDGLAEGVKRQEKDCRAYAKRHGWEVVELYRDNDLSAYSGKPRPAYLRMLQDLQAGHIDTVLAWHPDRLHRSPRELEDFIDLIESTKAMVSTVTAGDYDLATPDGRLAARIVGSVARKESEDKSRRARRKMLANAHEGKPHGGTRPFGYEKGGMVIEPTEAAELRELARRLLAGESLRALVMDLNRRGIAPVGGKLWCSTSLGKALRNPRLAGFRTHQKTVVGKAMWPPIIDELTHKRMVAKLTDPSRRKNDGSTARKYLLAGFLVCGRCGERLFARPRNVASRRYVCRNDPGSPGCGRLSQVAEPLENFVVEAVFASLDSPEFAKACRSTSKETGTEERALVAKLEQDRGARGQLTQDHYDGVLDRADFLATKKRLDDRIEANERRLAQLQERSVMTALPGNMEALRQAWAERGLDWRREVISVVIEKIVIAPGKPGTNSFDPSRVGLVWRA
jgi:DNA invertase Pin-like site-specific DNA recombinase